MEVNLSHFSGTPYFFIDFNLFFSVNPNSVPTSIMKITMNELRKEVSDSITQSLAEEVANYVAKSNLDLVGGEKPRSFHKDMAYLTMYRDLQHVSYEDLEKQVLKSYTSQFHTRKCSPH